MFFLYQNQKIPLQRKERKTGKRQEKLPRAITSQPTLEQTNQAFFISCKKLRIETNTSFYGCFYLGPFDPGQSLTIANALRRTLLSELKGIAITSVEIDGAFHEYSILKGIQDSVLDILLNLKEIVLKKKTTFIIIKQQIGYLRARGPGIIRAKDLILPPFIQCVNPEQYIATLSEDGIFNMKFFINQGKNYHIQVSSKNFNSTTQLANRLLIDSIFMPVLKVNYIIESNEQANDFLSEPPVAPLLSNTSLSKKPKTLHSGDSRLSLREHKLIPLSAQTSNSKRGSKAVSGSAQGATVYGGGGSMAFPPKGETGHRGGNTKWNRQSGSLPTLKDSLSSSSSPKGTVGGSPLGFREADSHRAPFGKKGKGMSEQEQDKLKGVRQSQKTFTKKNSMFFTPDIHFFQNNSLAENSKKVESVSVENKKKKVIFEVKNQVSRLSGYKTPFNPKGMSIAYSKEKANRKKFEKINLLEKQHSFKTLKKTIIVLGKKKFLKNTKKPILNYISSPLTNSLNIYNQKSKKIDYIGQNLIKKGKFSLNDSLIQKRPSIKETPDASLINFKLNSFNTAQSKIDLKQNIILEIWTNGSLHPRDALYEGLKNLLSVFSKLKQIKFLGSIYKSEKNYKNFLNLFVKKWKN